MLSAFAAPLLALGLVAPLGVPPVIGLHVPWAAGGAHLDEHGKLTHEPESWPGFDFPAVRLWDTRTTWADLEPRDDAWTFSHLDAHLAVAESHGTSDVLLVLAGTPAWAARDPQASGAPWLPTGSASPPRSIQEWREYVRTVATRYAGRIDAYQIGNEPNLSWFWQGSSHDMARLVRAGAQEIHRVDPDARVVAPAPIVTTAASTWGAGHWWRVMEHTGVDALALQWYPPQGTPPTVLATVLGRMRERVDGTHLAGLPIWITEVNHSGGERHAGAIVEDTMRVAQHAEIERVYWYAWTRIGPPALMDFQDGTAAALALQHLTRERRSHTRWR